MLASSPITSWQIDGETVETATDYFLGLQNHCRWWLQPWNLKILAPWKKSYEKTRQCIKRAKKDITSLTKVHIVKALFFSSIMYRCESWTIKKAKHWRIDAFELWYWRRLLRVPWTARSNQSILKEINPEYSLEELLLKLKLQYLATCCKEWTHWKRLWSWERLRVGGEEATVGEMVGWHHWLNGHELGKIQGGGEGQGSSAYCHPWSHDDLDKIWWLNNNVYMFIPNPNLSLLPLSALEP